ncbi:MAG: hypothetical protein V2A73_04520 [Pseudomonadota bacterium]
MNRRNEQRQCDRVRLDIAAFDELSSEDRRHLERCPECSRLATERARIRAVLASRPSPDLTSGIETKLAIGAAGRLRARRRLAVRLTTAGSVAAVLLLSLVVRGGFAGSGQTIVAALATGEVPSANRGTFHLVDGSIGSGTASGQVEGAGPAEGGSHAGKIVNAGREGDDGVVDVLVGVSDVDGTLAIGAHWEFIAEPLAAYQLLASGGSL